MRAVTVVSHHSYAHAADKPNSGHLGQLGVGGASDGMVGEKPPQRLLARLVVPEHQARARISVEDHGNMQCTYLFLAKSSPQAKLTQESL